MATVAARISKALVVSVTVGTPRASSSTLSWIHHAVQAPQLPMPQMTASARCARSSISGTASFREAMVFFSMTSAAP
mgnify:CR=1 FL=1